MKKLIVTLLGVALLSCVAYETNAMCTSPASVNITFNGTSATVTWSLVPQAFGYYITINGTPNPQIAIAPWINSYTFYNNALPSGATVCVKTACASGASKGTCKVAPVNCGYSLVPCPNNGGGCVCDFICILDPNGNLLGGVNETVIWNAPPGLANPTGGCNNGIGLPLPNPTFPEGTVFNVTVTNIQTGCSQTIVYTLTCSTFDGAADPYSQDSDEGNIAKVISVFPNPTNSVVNISSILDQNLSIEIYNTRGQRLIVESMVDTPSKSIDLSALPQGVYLMHIRDMDTQEYISFEKLIVTK